MKVTRHKDGTVSLRLRKRSFGDGAQCHEDIVFALGQAALGFEAMAHKFPAEAKEYNDLATHYRRLRDDVEAAVGLR